MFLIDFLFKDKKREGIMDKYNNYNILGYILVCTAYIGTKSQEIPFIFWLITGIVGSLVLIYSDVHYRNKNYLRLDGINLLILFLVVQALPKNVGLLLNVLVLIVLLILLKVKSKVLKKYSKTIR